MISCNVASAGNRYAGRIRSDQLAGFDITAHRFVVDEADMTLDMAFEQVDGIASHFPEDCR